MSRFVFALAAIAPLAVQAAVPLYGQCGGLNYTGETECVAGAVCIYQNDWYYQCVAGSATTTPASTSSTPTTSSSSTSFTSTKTSSSSTKTSSTSTKTSSTSTKISSTSTRTSTTSSGGSPPPTGITSVLPASAGYTKLASASTISGSFDGGMRKYDRAGSSGDCQDQTETDEAAAVFILLPGATISNVIIGKAQAEGIHCRGTCTLRNIFWEDVCEDAATFKQTGSGDVSYVIGGGAWSGSDKIFQHNGAGTVSISNFYASSFGKLYRACGNCSTSYQRHVILNNIKMHGGSEGVGINTNWGDTAKISNVCTNGKPSATNVCCRYKGVAKGSEPSKIGCGADSSCQISGSIGSC